MSGSDTICNNPNPPLGDIVLFGLSLSGFPFRASPQDFKTRMLGEGFHTLIKGLLFSSPTNVGYHNVCLLPQMEEENDDMAGSTEPTT